jgi:hypothetical protein
MCGHSIWAHKPNDVFFSFVPLPRKEKRVEDMAEYKEKKKYLLLTLPLSDR